MDILPSLESGFLLWVASSLLYFTGRLVINKCLLLSVPHLKVDQGEPFPERRFLSSPWIKVWTLTSGKCKKIKHHRKHADWTSGYLRAFAGQLGETVCLCFILPWLCSRSTGMHPMVPHLPFEMLNWAQKEQEGASAQVRCYNVNFWKYGGTMAKARLYLLLL